MIRVMLPLMWLNRFVLHATRAHSTSLWHSQLQPGVPTANTMFMFSHVEIFPSRGSPAGIDCWRATLQTQNNYLTVYNTLLIVITHRIICIFECVHLYQLTRISLLIYHKAISDTQCDNHFQTRKWLWIVVTS